MKLDHVIANDNGHEEDLYAGIEGNNVVARDVVANGNGKGGLSAGTRVTVRGLTANDNGISAGVNAPLCRLDAVAATGNKWGASCGRGSIKNSTLTGNAEADILAGSARSPSVRNTICDTSYRTTATPLPPAGLCSLN